MGSEHIQVTGFIHEASPGRYTANACAVRTWDHFAVQMAKLTSVAFATRAEAERQLQRLIDDLNGVLGPGADLLPPA